MAYIGRFAPSPTGPLHFGSLVAAVASYLEAKTNQGQWLVRMEDLDQPREVAGAANHILHTLEAFGFVWDGDVLYQSQRQDAYEATLTQLQKQGMVYPCTCTRKEIATNATQTGIEGAIYPRTCFNHRTKANHPVAWRLKTEDSDIAFEDAVQGVIQQNLIRDVGDFVLKRADGFFAYQLAVVVDDAMQGITHIVRGADLLTSTPRQIYLQNRLGLTTPRYTHIPIATNAAGQKLSKQTLALGLNAQDSVVQLWDALCFLNQAPPVSLQQGDLAQCWAWAMANWQLSQVPKTNQIAI